MLLNIISPHQDDAALSLSLALAEFVRRGIPVRVTNCFTESRFTPFKPEKCGDDNIRAREDQAFAAEFRDEIGCINLGHVDAPLRTGRGLRGIFLGKTPTPADELEIRELARDIQATAKSDVLIIPLAADLHVDHFLAREAALSLCPARPFAIYEDLPYAAHLDDSEIREKVSQLSDRLGKRLHSVLLGRGQPLQLKRRSISVYSSQISGRTINKTLDFSSRYDGAERLWVTADLMDELAPCM